MSFTKKDLAELVATIAVSNGQNIVKDWLVHNVLSELQHDEESDADVCCRQIAVTKQTEEYFRKLKGSDPAVDPQMKFQDFERVQYAYLINRDEASIGVPTEDITDEEILNQIIPRLEKQISGCQLHIEELERYMEMRKEKNVA